MKTIIGSFIAIFVFGMIAIGQTTKTNSKNTIIVQSIESSVSVESLSESADIISNRLKDFKSKRFTISVIPENNQIKVTLKGDWDENFTKDLIVQKGTLACYETYSRKDLSILLSDGYNFFSTYNSKYGSDSSSEIVCVSLEDVEKINDNLNSNALDRKCKFVWGRQSASSATCLYALKTIGDEGAILKGTDIASMSYTQNKTFKFYEVHLRLNESGADLWADATRRNVNKTIAFVLDDKLYSAPIVNAPIIGGRASISSNFSKSEAAYIASLGKNGELPIDLKIIK
jgi:preprotein translocase subunit SecD